ncbi:MAG: glycosyltransferase, partial [candidate division KSB1 bacterium]|nr:glycosyltransferase [candidate division KSB1 bacterium]
MKGLEEGMVMGLADEASPKARTRVPAISVIVALRNHASLLSSLCADLLAVLKELGGPFEIVLVDDGSTDTTYAQAELLARSHRSVKAVRLRSTFGEGSAFDAGLKVARGRTIVYMAGRVLTDPHGVRALVEKLAEGADLVMAWR